MSHLPTILFISDLTLPSKFDVRHIPTFSPVSYYSLFPRPKDSLSNFGSHTTPIHVISIQQNALPHTHSIQEVDLLTGLLTESVAELSLDCGICKVTQLSGNCACLPRREASCGSFNHLLQFVALSSPLLGLNITGTHVKEEITHTVRTLAVELPTCIYKFTRMYVQYLSYEKEMHFLKSVQQEKSNYSTKQSPSGKANWFSAIQEIPRIYGARSCMTTFTSDRHLSLSWDKVSVQLRGFQYEHFVKWYIFRARRC
jgi:hypothetical protein